MNTVVAEYVDSRARLLAKLLEEGSLPKSAVSESQRSKLESLFTGKILREEPRGGGYCITVQSRSGLSNYVKKHYPAGLKGEDATSDLPRKSAIESRRNSKLTNTSLPQLNLFRIFNRASLVSEARISDPADATREAGVFSIHDEYLQQWDVKGTLGTVENWELFNEIESVAGFDEESFPRCFLYSAGNLSDRLVNWMKTQKGLSKMVHLGDYDPVGLRNYTRLKNKLDIDVCFFTPENLDELFENYSNQSLLEAKGSRRIFDKVRNEHSGDPEIREIIELIQNYNAGLEQEILARE